MEVQLQAFLTSAPDSVSDQLQTPIKDPSPSINTEEGARWAPQPVWTPEKSLLPCLD
jgi:hypothetical protein